MNRHLSIPCCNQFIPMHHDSHQQLLCMETKPMFANSGLISQHLSMRTPKPYISSSKSHHSSFPMNPIELNHHLSMPSLFDQFPSMHQRFSDEDHSLRIHVGNIPFLWTVDDLCKQFLLFGPIKDPEIVSNERGSKGFGFITFLRQTDGINAIRVKNGSIADGRKITVALASSRSSNRMNSCHCHCCSINNNNNVVN